LIQDTEFRFAVKPFFVFFSYDTIHESRTPSSDQYDPLGRLISVTDSANHPLVEMAYDVLGNVTHVVSTNSVFDYTYDSLNRATQAVCVITNIPGFTNVKYQIDYGFDPVGNLTNRLISGLTGFTDTTQTRYQYDVMNRLTNVVQLTKQWKKRQEPNG
jgi:YD repeat-containing protein